MYQIVSLKISSFSENTAEVVQALFNSTTINTNSKTKILPIHLEIECIFSHAREINTSVRAFISYYGDNSTAAADSRIRKAKVSFDRKSVVFEGLLH
jgi:hypothetical protein